MELHAAYEAILLAGFYQHYFKYYKKWYWGCQENLLHQYFFNNKKKDSIWYRSWYLGNTNTQSPFS